MNQASVSRLRPPVTAKGQRTRQQLLAAAEVVFGEKGYEAASIAEITQRAEVALGTFYLYFTDKKQIFVELVDELGKRLRRRIAEAVGDTKGRLEVERRGFAAFFAFASAHRGMYRIVRQAEFVDLDAFTRYYRTIADGYRRGLAAAMGRGEIRRMDPERLAYCLMGIADFLGMRWVLWESDAQMARVLATAMDFIEHGLSPAPKTRARQAPAAAPRRSRKR